MRDEATSAGARLARRGRGLEGIRPTQVLPDFAGLAAPPEEVEGLDHPRGGKSVSMLTAALAVVITVAFIVFVVLLALLVIPAIVSSEHSRKRFSSRTPTPEVDQGDGSEDRDRSVPSHLTPPSVPPPDQV